MLRVPDFARGAQEYEPWDRFIEPVLCVRHLVRQEDINDNFPPHVRTSLRRFPRSLLRSHRRADFFHACAPRRPHGDF